MGRTILGVQGGSLTKRKVEGEGFILYDRINWNKREEARAQRKKTRNQ